MKILHNEDGTITVFVPKTDEVYDSDSGTLLIPCVTTAKDLRALLKDAPDAEPVVEPA